MTEGSTPPWLPAWFSAEEIDTVLVVFPDVFGRLMGKRFTRTHFVRSVVEAGTHVCNYLLTVDLDLNPLDGFAVASWDQGFGDFHLKPDLTTLRRLPWIKGTAMVLCDVEHENGAPVAVAPRNVLKRQLEQLAGRGWQSYMASELEFYLFHETYEAASAKRYHDLLPASTYLIDYDALQPARDENVIRRLRNEMNDAGIIVEGSKGEWGLGQHELNLLYAEALEMADRHTVFKYGAKQIAAQESRAITFMAKFAADRAGSSFHLHTSLWDKAGKQNLFADGHGEGKLFRAFLGGLLKYGRELSYFFAPTINAYKRYQAGSWAPTALVWSHDNRTTGFRVVGHGASLRIENRMPGADANPYLTYAATLAAGLRGIDEELDCGKPYQGNAYIDAELPKLPRSLDEAAELLAGSSLAEAAFGKATVEYYVHTARLECHAHRQAVTDWDRTRYFERI